MKTVAQLMSLGEEAPLTAQEWGLVPEVFRPPFTGNYHPRVIVPYRSEMGCPPLFEGILIAERIEDVPAPIYPSPLIDNEDYGSISHLTVALLSRWSRADPVAFRGFTWSSENWSFETLRVLLQPASDNELTGVDRIGGAALLDDGEYYSTALLLHRLIDVGDADDLMICLWESEGWEFEDEVVSERGPVSGTFHIRPR